MQGKIFKILYFILRREDNQTYHSWQDPFDINIQKERTVRSY